MPQHQQLQEATCLGSSLALGIGLILTIIVATRILLTYKVFNQTFDEPAHLAAGMEWLQKGTYKFERLHPPLARICIGLGPFLAGVRLTGPGNLWVEGNRMLYSGGQYFRNLTLARLGVLPFLLLAIVVVFSWSWKLFGPPTAALAVLVFTTTPPVLAHSGLATTDIPLAATVVGALFAFAMWLDDPSTTRTVVLGLAMATAILSKFSAVLFLPFCGAALVLCQWMSERNAKGLQNYGWRRRVRSFALALMVASAIVWSGYRFSVRPAVSAADRPHESIDQYFPTSGKSHALAYWIAECVPLPAPDLIMGLNELRKRNSVTNVSYILGGTQRSGAWYFFPVSFALKTPLPFLILTAIGVILLVRNVFLSGNWRPLGPASAAVIVLLVCLPSRINVGVRHILPMYLLLSIVVGFAAMSLWKLGANPIGGRVFVTALLLWQVIASVKTHPDHLAYFNELAGRHPDKILVDSDLDWGQDLERLTRALRARRVDAVRLAYFGTADTARHNLPGVVPLEPYQRTTGWIAVSETAMKMGRPNPPWSPPYDGFSWLERYEPVELVGRSIRLYYLSDRAGR